MPSNYGSATLVASAMPLALTCTCQAAVRSRHVRCFPSCQAPHRRQALAIPLCLFHGAQCFTGSSVICKVWRGPAHTHSDACLQQACQRLCLRRGWLCTKGGQLHLCLWVLLAVTAPQVSQRAQLPSPASACKAQPCRPGREAPAGVLGPHTRQPAARPHSRRRGLLPGQAAHTRRALRPGPARSASLEA